MAVRNSPETLRLLAERIRQVEAGSRTAAPATIPLGANGLGELFPARALPAGALVELVAGVAGAGAWTLSLLLARHVCGELKMLLVADHQHCFYPPAALKLGVQQRRTVIVRSPNPRDTLLALSQSLRCPAVGAAVGQFERLSERDSRRLQLAAEAGGGIGVLVRPASAQSEPSFAPVRWLLNPLPSRDGCRRVLVEVLRCRGGRAGRTLAVEINDATGDVRAFPHVAGATGAARVSRITG